jgi:glutamyl-tRNA reductase
VLSSTGASHFILEPKKVAEVLRRRKLRPMFFIDIAVPRDIDPTVNSLENVYLYNTDDLQGVVENNMEQRRREAEKAEEIVAGEIGQFLTWLSSLEVVPTIVALRGHFEGIRRAELAKTISSWKDLSPDDEKRLEALTSAMVNKLLHVPTNVLKQTGQGNRTDLYLDALQNLFALSTEPLGGQDDPLRDEDGE